VSDSVEQKTFSTQQEQSVDLVRECIMIRDNVLTLPGFYRAMHFSAKRGIAIACRPSVCLSVRLSVCNVGGSGPHRLEILETN